MSLGEFINTLWKCGSEEVKNNKNIKNIKNMNNAESIDLKQGLEYKSFKKDRQTYLKPSLTLIENFEGLTGNIKNLEEAGQHRVIENKFNKSLSEYAIAQKNLMAKTQNYFQNGANSKQMNKNIYALQAQNPVDIHPKWKGCYAGGNGLVYQEDMGSGVTLTGCATRATDLGYSNFAVVGGNSGKCYVGNASDDNKMAYTTVVSYGFKPNKNAMMGGLLKNGQIGTFTDSTLSGLVTDLPAVAGCDPDVGGYINAKSSVASFGANCNNVPPAPAPITTYIPHLDNTGKHMTWDSSDKYAQSKGGRLATFNELLDYIRQKGGNALVPNQDQWVAVTNGYNGAKRDWEQIGNPGMHWPGKSHVQYLGYPGWGDTLINAAWNVYVFWMEPANTAPVTAVDCSKYGDNDTGLPHQCLQELWNKAGCLTDSTFADDYWSKQSKKNVITDMGNWSTMTDDKHRTGCYGADKTKWPAMK